MGTLADLTEVDMKRLFDHFDEEDDGYMTNAQFGNYCKLIRHVLSDTVATKEMDMKKGIVRRLEAGELVEVLEGPITEGEHGIPRARCRFLLDDAEGWLTLTGNQGTELVGNVLQCTVIKPISLTRAPSLDNLKPLRAGPEKRMLKENETVTL